MPIEHPRKQASHGDIMPIKAAPMPQAREAAPQHPLRGLMHAQPRSHLSLPSPSSVTEPYAITAALTAHGNDARSGATFDDDDGPLDICERVAQSLWTVWSGVEDNPFL